MSTPALRIDHHPRRGALRPGAGLLVLGAALVVPQALRAQCVPAWSGLNGGTSWDCNALETFAETSYSPSLYIAGGFNQMGGVWSPRIARWDGWRAMNVGTAWPSNPNEWLQALDSCSPPWPPPGLHTGGTFSQTGQGPANSLARWLMPQWHDVGGGLTAPPGMPQVFALHVHDDDGAGSTPPALYVGGLFKFAGGLPVQGLARWSGSSWSGVGGAMSPTFGSNLPYVNAMATFDDDGAGPRRPGLYGSGDFSAAGGVPASQIARWDGQAWEALAQGFSISGPLRTLCVFDEDGSGPGAPALFAGGATSVWTGSSWIGGIARWDGHEWSRLGTGTLGIVAHSMAVFDDDGPGPNRPSLFVGGLFPSTPSGVPVHHLARWDGQEWHDVGGGVTGFGSATGVDALTVFDEDGPGPNPGGLYVGGLFYFAGGVQSHHVARWGCPLPPRCDANCNKDFHPITGQHILTVADFGCFQTRYVLQDPAADCNEDGALTVADFGCFQTKFVTGCP